MQIKAAGIGAEASRQPACHGRHDAVDRVREAGGAVHQHYGRVDGLVNHAGRRYAASVEEIEPAVLDEIFHLSVLGSIVAMQAVIPLMRAQGAEAS